MHIKQNSGNSLTVKTTLPSCMALTRGKAPASGLATKQGSNGNDVLPERAEEEERPVGLARMRKCWHLHQPLLKVRPLSRSMLTSTRTIFNQHKTRLYVPATLLEVHEVKIFSCRAVLSTMLGGWQ